LGVAKCVVAACVLLIASGFVVAGGKAGAGRVPFPTGIAAAGDSLSTGYGSIDRPGDVGLDHPENSWSIGDNDAVDSQYARIRRHRPGIAGHTMLVAEDGAVVADLAGQLRRVAARPDIDYVTIQIGSNDICDARRRSQITPVAVFRRRFAAALTVLGQASRMPLVLVTSIADEANWNDAVLRIPSMVHEIEDGTVCDPRPGSDGHQNPAVRALITGYEAAYDRALAAVCAHYPTCLYDGGALTRLKYRPQDVSRHDALHPSVIGLARMAAVTWQATFRFS
jgi:lysophospholipase L1-like esterase